jgi:hypothetical protein
MLDRGEAPLQVDRRIRIVGPIRVNGGEGEATFGLVRELTAQHRGLGGIFMPHYPACRGVGQPLATKRHADGPISW